MDELRRLYTILNIMPKDMDVTNKNLLAQFSPKKQVRLVWCLQHGARQHVLCTWPAAASGRVSLGAAVTALQFLRNYAEKCHCFAHQACWCLRAQCCPQLHVWMLWCHDACATQRWCTAHQAYSLSIQVGSAAAGVMTCLVPTQKHGYAVLCHT